MQNSCLESIKSHNYADPFDIVKDFRSKMRRAKRKASKDRKHSIILPQKNSGIKQQSLAGKDLNLNQAKDRKMTIDTQPHGFQKQLESLLNRQNSVREPIDQMQEQKMQFRQQPQYQSEQLNRFIPLEFDRDEDILYNLSSHDGKYSKLQRVLFGFPRNQDNE